jgi:hypothetical protein
VCQTPGVFIAVFMCNMCCINSCPVINGYNAKTILIFHDTLRCVRYLFSGTIFWLTRNPDDRYTMYLILCFVRMPSLWGLTKPHANWLHVVRAHEGHGPMAKIAGNRILASNREVRWQHKRKWWSYQNGNRLSLRSAELCIQKSLSCFEQSSE